MNENRVSVERVIRLARLIFLLIVVPAIILIGTGLSLFSFKSYISLEARKYNQERLKVIEQWWRGSETQGLAAIKLGDPHFKQQLDTLSQTYPWAIYKGDDLVLKSKETSGRFVSNVLKLGDETFSLRSYYDIPFFFHLFNIDIVILIVPLIILMGLFLILVEIFFGYFRKIISNISAHEFATEQLAIVENNLIRESLEREIIQDERDFLKGALDQFAAYAMMDMQGYFLQMNNILKKNLKLDDFSSGKLSFESLLNEPQEFVLMLHQLHKFKRWQGEINIRRFDGVYCYLDATILQYTDKLVLFANDITFRKEYESEMLSARNEALSGAMAKSRFLANMSHEIRTPLNGILGMLELIQRDSGREKQQERLLIIQQSAEHLLHVLNDILDFSKIEAGKIFFEQIPFNLKDLCSRTLSLFELKGHEKGLDITLDWPANADSVVVGDPTRIGQVLNNLLSNAIKFTDRGFVSLKVNYTKRDDLGLWRIAVIDSGTGIKDIDKSKVFGSFSQVDGSISRKYGGTGLGLAISKNLAQIMGGDLVFNSEWGIGSEFIFSLSLLSPKVEQGSEVIYDVELFDPERRWRKDLKVLVAEDNDINQMVVANFLSVLGIQSDWAKTGIEALDASRKNDYDLILMDIQMPEMDGMAASRMIRQEYGKRELVIIALTANSSQEDRDQAINAGMDDFLSKPFRMAELELKLIKYFPNINKERNNV